MQPSKLQAPSSRKIPNSKAHCSKRLTADGRRWTQMDADFLRQRHWVRPIQNEQIKNASMPVASGNLPILNFAFLIHLKICVYLRLITRSFLHTRGHVPPGVQPLLVSAASHVLRFSFWCLGFGAFLELRAWSLELPAWLFLFKANKSRRRKADLPEHLLSRALSLVPSPAFAEPL